jgi:long-chain fatty acid transport protein
MQTKNANIGRLSTLAAMMLAALSAGTAQATNGYFEQGYGIKSQGIGGVGIALPQDGLAAASNPAGSVFLGNRFDLGISWFSPKRGADIVGNAAPVNGSYDGNGKRNFYIPEVGFVKQFSPSLAAGIAIYGNGGMNTTYKSGIPLFGTGEAGVNLEQLFISPNLAWKLTENHAIGAAVNFAYQGFEARGLRNFDHRNFSSSPGNVTDRGIDTSTGWGLRLGYTGKLTSRLSIGAAWSPKISMARFDKYRGLFAGGGSFDIPGNYGIGAVYQVTPGLSVAADINRILYGGIRAVAAPLSNFASGQLGAANGPGFGWKNINVYKVGVAYDLNPSLTLRAGYNHSDQPVPASETLFNILAPGVVQNHPSIGGTLKVADNGELSIGYTRALKKTVYGSNSIPQNFGGGNANVSLAEHIPGIAYGWRFR